MAKNNISYSEAKNVYSGTDIIEPLLEQPSSRFMSLYPDTLKQSSHDEILSSPPTKIFRNSFATLIKKTPTLPKPYEKPPSDLFYLSHIDLDDSKNLSSLNPLHLEEKFASPT